MAWESMQDALESFDPLYLGLEDLAESHVGYPLGRDYTAMLYALLLIPLKILEANIGREGNLQLKLRRDPRFKSEDVAFGVVVKPEAGVPSRYTLPISKTKVVQERKDVELVQLDVPVTGYAEVIVQLRARNEILSTTRLYPGISSPRLRCHRILDPYEAHLEKALTEYKGKRFEQAVAMLLHLAGFKVEDVFVLEALASDKYADILAFTPDEQTVLVGACVFKNPSPQDVTLLAQSYLTTKSELDNSTLTVTPILFTSMPSGTLSESLRQQAQRENIAIATKEDLLRILDLVRSGGGPGEILQVFPHFSPFG